MANFLLLNTKNNLSIIYLKLLKLNIVSLYLDKLWKNLRKLAKIRKRKYGTSRFVELINLLRMY